MPFTSLGLSPALAQAASDQGYLAPTAVQSAAVPAVLQGHDVLATAQTGSGKTAAYCLPLLQQWLAGRQAAPRQAQTLILLPTRELAAQVGDALRQLSQGLPRRPKIAVVFGGVSINPQMMALRGGADIVAATPGRLLDLLAHNALRLSAVDTLVLDEADRLLDLGFADELSRVLALLPPYRQNLLFSATFPPAVHALAERLLNQPQRIDIAPGDTAAPDIRQRVIEVDAGRRTMLLRHLLQTHGWDRALVFVASRHSADRVAGKLQSAGVRAAALHGDCSQGQRGQVLADLKSGRLQVLVATDVAARGIDIARLPVVINYDLPRSPVDYTHRIGRTGRAGAGGEAVSFVSADCAAHFQLIEKRQRLRLPRERIPGFEPVVATIPAPGAAADNGGVKGKRKSKKDKLREAAAQAQAEQG
ncbi:superfamily II DNA/RNA helicase [Chromobacterium alkanivorans]|uniref:DEAD/DEAH box helicase n=1 Tax=Chromobacterium alkanivorans TaxID=1071719 RepID=UPI002166FAA4|nr:DEAD/DEAH box helicase [Chromobacterium alkanivorans]MCS3804531.1 superfamily II DNA/RNA helicase [Chromobacterium alkanivorans]MCS3818870.1 superfamily II DNA/RNA helicase [Chromobacterium alkanivorans]MCS3873272.1 superfamily II DNA/RNA helicase [Chromobacterium alkanivorans]